MTPTTYSAQKKTGGQREEGHEVVHHVQEEHDHTNMLQTPSKCQHPGWTNLVQDGPNVDKDMVERNSPTLLLSESLRST